MNVLMQDDAVLIDNNYFCKICPQLHGNNSTFHYLLSTISQLFNLLAHQKYLYETFNDIKFTGQNERKAREKSKRFHKIWEKKC